MEPAHPDSFSASGITEPVLFPSSLSSTLWLKTGTVVLEATACSIGTGGAMIISTSIDSETFSAALASRNPRSPRISP